MKKKLVCLFLATAMIVSAAAALTACGPNVDIKELVTEAQKMSTTEILEKAKTEKGNFAAYGNTSRIASAMEKFVTKYGTELGLTATTATATKKDDKDIYSTLDGESKAWNKSQNASMVMIQDGAQLLLYTKNSNILQNYIPKAIAGKVGQDDLVPLVHQFTNKLFMWNNTGSDVPAFSNVWELTESAMSGKIFFKNPNAENVNGNFLITITSDAWAAKLKTAYKAYKGTEIVLDADCPNAGYQWVKGFLQNVNFSIDSDTKIAENLSKTDNHGAVGLFVLSKLRAETVLKDNLQVGAWVKDTQDNYVKMDPFAGFMYPIYCQLAASGPRPYTAMLFIDFLMQEEGFSAWKKSIGAYSPNSDIAEFEGDSPLSFWKENLVVEDAAYIKENKSTVGTFIDKIIDAKS